MNDQKTTPTPLSVSLAEEIAREAFFCDPTVECDCELLTAKAAQIIQRRVEPLERRVERSCELLNGCVKMIEIVRAHSSAGQDFKIELDMIEGEIKAFLARIKEGSVCKD